MTTGARLDAVQVQVRTATSADVAPLAEVAAATFALACPPHVAPASVATFIRDVLSPERFAAYLADPDRVLFLAEATGPERDRPVCRGLQHAGVR